MLFFAITHSILARLSVKGWFRTKMGEREYEGFYRILYNVVSVLTLLPAGLVLISDAGSIMWSVEGPIAIGFRLLQLIGLVGLSLSILQIDGGRFIGTSQVVAYLTGEPLPLPPEPLQTGGVYRIVRHPLYLFSLMLLWFTPTMTSTSLVFVICATAYFMIGSWFEERTMIKLFGAPYQKYQRKQVKWMA
ncbi:MAG: NnrU family protein, partial [Chloroflexota bacterium]